MLFAGGGGSGSSGGVRKPARPKPDTREAPRPDRGGGRPAASDRYERLTPYEIPLPKIELPQEQKPRRKDDGLINKILGLTDKIVFGEREDEVEAMRTQRHVDAAEAERKDRGEKPEVARGRSVEMTWDRYNKLSDVQKAGVDFNTLLIQAREKDLNTDYDPTKGERRRYDRLQAEMFGKEHGSETFAPETLAVLDQIDFDGKAAAEDMDNFLGLKAGVSLKELGHLDDKPIHVEVQAPFGVEVGGEVRSLEQQLAAHTEAMQKAMARTMPVVSKFTEVAAHDRSGTVAEIGGDPEHAGLKGMGLGWGKSTVDSEGENRNIHDWFREAFNTLADERAPQAAIDDVWTKLNTPGVFTPGQKQAFMHYLDEKSDQLDLFGLKTGQGKGWRTAEEFRSEFGLDQPGGL